MRYFLSFFLSVHPLVHRRLFERSKRVVRDARKSLRLREIVEFVALDKSVSRAVRDRRETRLLVRPRIFKQACVRLCYMR